MQYTDLKINPDILFKDMGDEGILLNSITSSYYRVNAFGVAVLNILFKESPSSFSENIQTLVDKYAKEAGEAHNKIQEDIDLFLEQLKVDQIVSS